MKSLTTACLAAILFWNTQATLAAENNKRIHFNRDSDISWKSCYTKPIEESLKYSQTEEFANLHGIFTTQKPFQSGDKIVLTYKNPNGSDTDVIKLLQECPFEYSDFDQLLECEISVKSKSQESPVSYLKSNSVIFQKQLDEQRVESFKHLDCKNSKMNPIQNSWTQKLRLSEIKTIKFLNDSNYPLVPSSAFGVVTEGGSLLPYQKWSSALQFNFLKDQMHFEVCDASVDEISTNSALPLWVGKTWCPWYIEITKLSCESKTIVEYQDKWSLPLDQTSHEIRNYCSKEDNSN